MLDEWIDTVKAELGIDLDVDTAALLDLARAAAHGVARPAAPLTTFLVGYAAGRAAADAGPEAAAEATRKAVALAARWARESDESPPGVPDAGSDEAPGPVVPGGGGPEGPGITGDAERSAE